ncbi:MAG: permease-like cell division protein FtsX [Patescibacteria group bacterium]
MMVTLSRIIKYGWQGFLRNGWLSVSTISIMILAAFVFGGLILFNIAGQNTVQSIQEKIDISVYFKSNISEDTILSIKKSLEGLSEVKIVDYVSQDQALADFKARHANEETITQTLEQLDVNPLLPALNIKARDPHEYEAIANYLEAADIKNQTEKVTYAQNQVVIDRLVGLVDTMKKTGLVLTVFLSFLAVTVTFNTIRLAIFSNSEQINIMRLVGASNSFIRGPYIFEGAVYGVISAIISFIALWPIINFISPHIYQFIPDVNLKAYFQDNIYSLFFYQFLFCAGLGIVSGIFAIRRYLRT